MVFATGDSLSAVSEFGPVGTAPTASELQTATGVFLFTNLRLLKTEWFDGFRS